MTVGPFDLTYQVVDDETFDKADLARFADGGWHMLNVQHGEDGDIWYLDNQRLTPQQARVIAELPLDIRQHDAGTVAEVLDTGQSDWKIKRAPPR